MKPNTTWKRVNSISLSNLNVLLVNGNEVGFITKPKNDRYNINMWRVFRGKGDTCQFLCWTSTKTQAQQTLEKVFIGY